MVLETLLRPESVESKPWEMFFYSVFITSVSLWIAWYAFPASASLVFLFFITLASFPLFYKILADDEKLDESELPNKMTFYERHKRTIKIFTYFFIGVVAATSLWASIIDAEKFEGMFAEQINTVKAIKGDSWNPTAHATKGGELVSILFNNVRVTTIAFLMSFFFGTGAIFILAWNASILAIFASGLARGAESMFVSHLNAFLSIALHAIPEMFAYFLAGIAGGILSIGLFRGNHDLLVMEDAFATFSVSIFALVVAAFLETYITPII